jgi:hypothetical protein
MVKPPFFFLSLLIFSSPRDNGNAHPQLRHSMRDAMTRTREATMHEDDDDDKKPPMPPPTQMPMPMPGVFNPPKCPFFTLFSSLCFSARVVVFEVP